MNPNKVVTLIVAFLLTTFQLITYVSCSEEGKKSGKKDNSQEAGGKKRRCVLLENNVITSFPRKLLAKIKKKTKSNRYKNTRHHTIVSAQEGGWPTDLENGAEYNPSNDVTAVYSTPGGLHFAYVNFGDACLNLFSLGLKLMEEQYVVSRQGARSKQVEDNNTKEGGVLVVDNNDLHSSSTIFASFTNEEYDYDEKRYTIDIQIPEKVKQSNRYKKVYRALPWEITDLVDNKMYLARQDEKVGVTSVFPPTYFTCESLLEKTAELVSEDENPMVFIKHPETAWGEGIDIKRRDDLLPENDNCGYGFDEDYIFQEAIKDLQLISGTRFDIRFFILFHDGHIYMHRNAWAMLPPFATTKNHQGKRSSDNISGTYNASSIADTYGFVKKFINGNVLYSFLHKDQTGVPKEWMDAIYESLSKAYDVLEPVAKATAGQNKEIWHIMGGDAMIRTNGEAVITEFNAWPAAYEKDVYTITLDEYGNEAERSTALVKNDYTFYASKMYSDFFAIVLSLVNTTTVSATTSTCIASSTERGNNVFLDGHVVEVCPQRHHDAASIV